MKYEAHPFEEKLLAQLSDDAFWPSQAALYLIGYSGGPDSQALVQALMRLRHAPQASTALRESVFVLCHFDHGWRPEKSEFERTFIEKTAETLGLSFVSSDVSRLKKQISHTDLPENALGETAARLYRHAFFGEVRKKFLANQDKEVYLLLAHHRDDRVETLLLNLFRGSGIDGLCAMPKRQAHVIRPLLNFKKVEILNYLSDRKLDFLLDETNEEGFTPRNRLRLELIPLLREILPQAETQLLHFSAQLDALRHDLLEPALNDCLNKPSPSSQAINLEKMGENILLAVAKKDLLAMPAALRAYYWKRRLADFLGKIENISKGHFQLLEEHLLSNHRKAQVFFQGTYLCSDQEEIRLWVKPCDQLSMPFLYVAAQEGEDDARVLLCQVDPKLCNPDALFEKAKILGYNFLTWFAPLGARPLSEWRQRKEGDYLVLKQGQRKRLKKFMSEQRMPFEIRAFCFLFCHNQEVQCLPSYFVRRHVQE